MERRKFIQNSLALSLGATALGSLSANTLVESFLSPNLATSPFFKLSLAQWSLHNAIQKGVLNPYDFAAKAKELGFEGIEYVNQLYKDITEAKDKNSALKQFITQSNAQAKAQGVENVLIMIDGEGDLAVPNASERNKAIENSNSKLLSKYKDSRLRRFETYELIYF